MLTDIHSLRSFLGIAGFYAEFLWNYSDEVETMQEVPRDDKTFIYTDAAAASFGRVTHRRLLCLGHVSLPTQVSTDASNYGLGAVLQQ